MYLEYEVYLILSILGLFWLKTNNIKNVFKKCSFKYSVCLIFSILVNVLVINNFNKSPSALSDSTLHFLLASYEIRISIS